MPLDIAETKSGSVIVLTLKGTLEIGRDTEHLTETVLARLGQGEKRFVLDLAGVRFIDSTGISALIKIHTSAKSSAGAMKLMRLTQRVHDVLQITRLSSVFEIYNDPAKALESFGESAATRSGENQQS
jgi:anti-sigma B factor antagonist